MQINGKTKITGIFGYPVTHSLSPAMHNAAFAELGLDYVYIPFQVSPRDLKDAVNALGAMGVGGINVTIPHKETIIPFLDHLSPLAAEIGSVNTVINSAGKLIGYNTDAPGFLADLKENRFRPSGKTAMLFGAGGAGKAVAAALSKAGVKTLYITDTDAKKAQALASKTPKAVFVPITQWKDKLPSCGLLVNATPVGMHPGETFVSAAELPKKLFVYDLVYNRSTELSKECRKKGVKYSNGLGMLLYQGAIAFEHFTGTKAPIAVMRKALEKQIAHSA
jgi:shikimate dehydrogenase